MRNFGIENARSEFVLTLDVDFVTSENAHSLLQNHLKSMSVNDLLIVPAFESEMNELALPKTKEQLIYQWLEEGNISPSSQSTLFIGFHARY